MKPSGLPADVDFAIAGDYGGSVRWPAQAARVFGLRLGAAHRLAGVAATGRIGLRPPDGRACGSQQGELETPGIMARSAEVLRAVLAVLNHGVPGGGARDRSESNAAPPRALIVSDGAEVAPVLPTVAAVMDAARAAAVRAGYRLVPAPDGLRDALHEAIGAYNALRAATDDHRAVRELAAGREELLCPSTRIALDNAARTVGEASPAEVDRLRALAAATRVRVRASLASAEAAALLMPLAASGPIGFSARVEVAGRMLDATGLMAHCRTVSLTGPCLRSRRHLAADCPCSSSVLTAARTCCARPPPTWRRRHDSAGGPHRAVV